MSIDATHDPSLSTTSRARDGAAFRVVGREGLPETGEMEGSFWDLLDVVNPLQHIPVVGTLYRAITGDTIKAPARIVGGALFGGPIGAMASIANAIYEEASGRDVGATVLAMARDEMTGDGTPGGGTTQDGTTSRVAAASAGSASPAAAPTEDPSVTAADVTPEDAAPEDAGIAMIMATGGIGSGRPERHPSLERNTSLRPYGHVTAKVSEPEAAEPEAALKIEIPASTSVSEAGGEDAAPTASTGAPGGSSSAQAAAWPPNGPAPLPPQLIADAMLMALNKYERSERTDEGEGASKIDLRY